MHRSALPAAVWQNDRWHQADQEHHHLPRARKERCELLSFQLKVQRIHALSRCYGTSSILGFCCFAVTDYKKEKTLNIISDVKPKLRLDKSRLII